jgi:outer membrane protein insertion porin family
MAEEKFLYLFPIGEEIFVVRLNGGIINSIGGKPVPVQDRFFLGGAESIRGYKYGTVSPTDEKGNYIGGKAYGLFSLEVRRSLTKSLEGALFYDSGRVFREPSQFKLSNWYSSVGFGIRYLTPVGPLRFDYGYKLKKVPGQGRGRFHISFGFPF